MRGPGRLRGAAATVGAIRNPGGIAQRMLLASVALALVVGAGFAILLFPVQEARNAERSALHSQDVLIAAHGLEQRVLDLERGQRGFILTRQPRFLMPWQQAREELPQEERALLRLVRGDPAQQARVREIARAARSYIDDYSVPLVNAAARGDPSAKTVAATAEGEARVRVIRADFAGLLEAERRTSAATSGASARAARRAYAGLVVGVVLSLALVALYAGYLTRAIVGPIRRAAALAGRVAGGDLTARLPETGVGEIGALQRSFNVMGASLERGRDELTALADEQAGLRRVATLVAQGASAGDLLAAVAAEIGQLFPVDYVLIGRYEDAGDITTVGSWSRHAGPADFPAERAGGVRKLAALVRRTGRPARTPSDEPGPDLGAPNGRAPQIRSSVGVPISVEGHLWGIVIAASTRGEPMPDAAETRLGSFTELVSTAIANAEAKAALTASRARIVVTADEIRRRLARDLHDGAQREFVNVSLRLQLARATMPPDLPEVAADLDETVVELNAAIRSLGDFARGIHPTTLTRDGLRPALDALARQCPVPVDLDLRTDGRLPEPIEVGAYYIVSEALTNAAKHAHASRLTVHIEAAGERVRLAVRDDGVGGADFGSGSGLVGLKDRVEALGGWIAVQSKPAAGTSVEVELPLAESVRGSSPGAEEGVVP
jgi:signal transduction histidine kinase